MLRNSEGSDPSNFETSDAIACRSLLRAAALFLALTFLIVSSSPSWHAFSSEAPYDVPRNAAYEEGDPGGAGGPAPGGTAGGGEVLQPGLERQHEGAFILRKCSIFGFLFFWSSAPVMPLVVQCDCPHECTAMDWASG